MATGIDLLAYRVIEAAINPADENHHAVEVTVEHAQAGLDVEITGRGPIAGLAEQLHGLSERVSLYDGRLTIGKHPAATRSMHNCRSECPRQEHRSGDRR